MLFLLFTVMVQAQEFQHGLYFVGKAVDKGDCLDPIKSKYADSTYCLTGLPFIASQDFESVSKIYAKSILGGSYFVITLKPSGIATIKVIKEKALAEHLGLVVNSRLVGRVNISELADQGIIRVGEGILHSQLKKLHGAIYSTPKPEDQLK